MIEGLSFNRNIDHISVCICTYKRPEFLADLLYALQFQETEGLFTFSIVVVDNDYLRSAESLVSSIKRKINLNTEYYVEETQNISLARNMAVLNAIGKFIAFIDDDEIPENSWLVSLYKALHLFNCDAVLGPVLPHYQVTPPKWIIKGKFYERPTYETGLKINWRKGRTGNILIKKEIFQASGEFFDPKFGSGGEDQDFTRRMLQKGYVFIWCNEARAYEIVPPIRWDRKFMMKRALLRGRMSLQYPSSRFILMMQSFLAISIYAMALPVLFSLGHHLFMQYLIKIFDHGGRILAMLNINIINQKYITQ